MKLTACDYCGKVGEDVRAHCFVHDRSLDPSGNGYEDITISFDACSSCYAEILYDALRDAMVNGVVKRRADNKKQIEYAIGERIRRAVAKKEKAKSKNSTSSLSIKIEKIDPVSLFEDEVFLDRLIQRIKDSMKSDFD
ncbi:MAG: hypothetical protein JRJ31_16915 [Deltaproteobacteria bacterium]|nr:hypothetical protein [Deltaproteobacteria bacterium]